MYVYDILESTIWLAFKCLFKEMPTKSLFKQYNILIKRLNTHLNLISFFIGNFFTDCENEKQTPNKKW